MKLYIKYMVSLRCKLVLKTELDRLGFRYYNLELGEVEIKDAVSKKQIADLGLSLYRYGLELMDDKKAVLLEKIKNTVVEMVHYADEPIKTNFSYHLSHKLEHDYNYLATLFSEANGITLEQFVIIHKIERAKELLLYDEYNLTQIANLLHYSSVSHLSNQFKKITGLTPSYFKGLKDHKKRIALELI